MKNVFIYEEEQNKLYTYLLYGGIAMQTNNTVQVDTRYVITRDGIRMSYKEYMDMIRSEQI